ncbi:pilus assembly protein N-terminal domain-containing protein [Microbulbifer bruguierae]|uniref:Pilus assembly protein N-terminal domain-containing protein n=1 Tax=Microbulbifer bruguierae TaxID=3029061 RepID=A0ABY8NCB6_9GAMM|nr:pilus assembly protein N-terminal domain-containing protein [Microbulbifer bruguierae]WGL15422.1 pilus assembly protein N-terminal domain-containing protein [Microbulbifer bruguierae]
MKACRKFYAVIFLLLAFVCSDVFAKNGANNLALHTGEVHILNIEGITRVAIGRPDVISYKTLDNGQIMIIAGKAGSTSLHLWRNGGREVRYWVDVEDRYVSDDVRIAQMLTKHLPALRAYSLDHRLVVEGEIDQGDIPVIEAIRAMVPNTVFLLRERPFAKKPLIRVDALLIEIGSNDVSKLGIDWNTSMSGPAWGFHKTITPGDFIIYESDPNDINEQIVQTVPIGDTSFFQYFGITSHLLSTINFLESSGRARILTSPKLTSASGEPATFHVGGSFPIPVINAVGAASVQREDYGVILEVLPTMFGDDINLEVSVDLSDIDPSVSVNGVPGTKNRRTETVVQLKHNQTVAISGLFATADSQANSGISYLSQMPVLKYLFGVEDSDIEDRQVVVLLTPKIITPGDNEDVFLSDFAREMITEYEAKLTVDAALKE